MCPARTAAAAAATPPPGRWSRPSSAWRRSGSPGTGPVSSMTTAGCWRCARAGRSSIGTSCCRPAWWRSSPTRSCSRPRWPPRLTPARRCCWSPPTRRPLRWLQVPARCVSAWRSATRCTIWPAAAVTGGQRHRQLAGARIVFPAAEAVKSAAVNVTMSASAASTVSRVPCCTIAASSRLRMWRPLPNIG